VTGHHQPIVDQDERVRQVPFAGSVQYLAKPLLDLWPGGVIVRYIDTFAINACEVNLCLPCGLLRRPSRPSTSHAYFVLAMPEDDDLYLFLSGHGLSVDFLHVNFYLCPST
jgi:hypothetical protein